MRLMLFVAAIVAIVTALGSDAFAQHATLASPGGDALRLSIARPIKTEVAGQPGPLRIDACFSDGRTADGLTVVHHALRFTNTGERAITGVRFRFALYDAFGDVSETRTGVAEARLEPGRTLDRVSLSEASSGAAPGRIVCSIDAIRYDDGSIARTPR